MKFILRLLTELTSRPWLSRLVGKMATTGASRRLIPAFIRLYRIQDNEAEFAWTEYASLNDFFTRKLKPDARPLDRRPNGVLSPVDGKITASGPIVNETLLQIKGRDYSVKELLHHSPRAVQYKQGWYWVIYLSPADYHRIHSPVSGTIEEKEHIPGGVYPVNDFSLRNLPRVLSRNERQVTYIRHDSGEMALVKVGALNVRSIRYREGLGTKVDRGEELARFEFGSTVVLLFPEGTCDPDPQWKEGDSILMGQWLGSLRIKPPEDPL